MYETTIDLIQRAMTAGQRPEWLAGAADVLRGWSPIDDFRVGKLLFGILGSREAENGCPVHDPSAIREPKSAPEPWSLCWAALTGSSGAEHRKLENEAFAAVEEQLARVLSRGEDFEDARAQLSKFGRNFGFDSVAKALAAFNRFATMSVENECGTLGLVALKSPSWCLGDLFYVQEDKRAAAEGSLQNDLAPGELGAWNTEGRGALEADNNPLGSYLLALRTRGSDLELALSVTETASKAAVTEGQRGLASNLDIQLCLALDEWRAAIAAISAEITRCPSTVSIVPAREAIAESLTQKPTCARAAGGRTGWWRG